MSVTSSELAVNSLLAHLEAGATASARHLVSEFASGSITELFDVLMGRTTAECVVGTGPETAHSAQAIVLGELFVVPYLVDEYAGETATTNRGGRGFNLRLRDYFDTTRPEVPKLLLTLDSAPIQGQEQGMDSFAVAKALSPRELLERALTTPAGATPVWKQALGVLRRHYASEVVSRHPLPEAALADVATAVAQYAGVADAPAAGAALGDFPGLLPDPGLLNAPNQGQRLRDSGNIRASLESTLDDPQKDFNEVVRGDFEDAVAESLVASRAGQSLRWRDLDFETLRSGSAPKGGGGPELAAVSVIAPQPQHVDLSDVLVVAACSAKPTGVEVELTTELVGNQRVHLYSYQEGSSGKLRRVALDSASKADLGDATTWTANLTAAAPVREAWMFLGLGITKGPRLTNNFLSSRKLAVFHAAPSPLVVWETDGNVSIERQSWVLRGADGQLDGRCGPEALEPAVLTEPDAGTVEERIVTIGGEQVSVPIFTEIPADQDDASGAEVVASPEHAALARWARGQPSALAAPRLRFAESGAYTSFADGELPVEGFDQGDTQRLGGLRRWEVERRILQDASVTAFRVTDSDLVPDENLQQLELGPLTPQWTAFMDAREGFFELVRGTSDHGASVMASDLTHMEEAATYIDAYRELLNAVPEEIPFRVEYYRLLLIDSIALGAGEILIAPTHPLAVAYHRRLQARTEDWTAIERAPNVHDRDFDLLSLRFAIPYLPHGAGDGWLESEWAPYPWRRYVRSVDSATAPRGPFVPMYMAQRIEAFLTVHPGYRKRSRTLAIACVNPGDAKHLVQALRHVLRRAMKRTRADAGPEGLDEVPDFELRLLSTGAAGAELGSELAYFAQLALDAEQADEIDVELAARLVFIKDSVSSYTSGDTAFAHLTFVEDLFRPTQLMTYQPATRQSTSYVDGLVEELERPGKVQANEVEFVAGIGSYGRPAGSEVNEISLRSLEVSTAAAGHPVRKGWAHGPRSAVSAKDLPALYDKSVWVVHMDKHIGLEVFGQSPVFAEQPPFLLDFTDQEDLRENAFDAITATLEVEPYLSRIMAVMHTQQGFENLDELTARQVLKWMNALSGRWAIRLLQNSPSDVRERIGTVVVSRVVGKEPVPTGIHRVLAPLDDVLRVTGKEGLALGQGWKALAEHTGKMSDDLLVVDVVPGAVPQVSFRIIEVKYRSTLGDSEAEAADQVWGTYRLLQELFVDAQKPGRYFRGRALGKLLAAALARQRAFVEDKDLPEDLRQALALISNGVYALTCEREQDGQKVIGDYYSVEPELGGGVQQASSVLEPKSGAYVGRVRIGMAKVEAIVAGVNAMSEKHDDHHGDDKHRVADPISDSVAVVKDDDGPLADPEPEAFVMPSADGAKVAASEEEVHLPDFAVAADTLAGFASRLDQVLGAVGINALPVDSGLIQQGPVNLRFRVRLATGQKISELESRARDIQRELGIRHDILIDQDPPYVTLDLPREEPVLVRFAQVRRALEARGRTSGEIPIVLGLAPDGSVRIADLATIPHLLIAGTTGSGKSVLLKCIVASAVQLDPSALEIVIIDPKGLDFDGLEALPHLRGRPPIARSADAVSFLEELIRDEFPRRREVLRAAKTRNIVEYLGKTNKPELRQLVIVIDEFAQLMLADASSKSRLEEVVQQFAQFARAYGIYMVLATQRPAVSVITGNIKANLPARCALRLPSSADSRTILGHGGAELLRGRGDFLFLDEGEQERLQAPLTEDDDILP